MARIISVGYEIPGYSEDYYSFDDDQSLLDADIVLFQPYLYNYDSSSSYIGKRRLSDSDSAKAVEDSDRWRQEITEILKTGKTVFIFLSEYEEVYVHLGQRQTSGTGRGQKVTLIVDPLNSFSCLPFDLGTIVPKGGKEIRSVGDLKWFAPYWAQYGKISPYKIYFKSPKGTPILSTTSSEAIVGLFFKVGKGTAILLPPVEYDMKKFVKKNKKGEDEWTKDAISFGDRLTNSLIQVDKSLKSENEITPAPAWVSDPQFAIQKELSINKEVGLLDKQMQKLLAKRDELIEEAASTSSLRDLLYESGKPLETAILRSLIALGFVAEQLKEGQSEFDSIFTSEEGRFLGEAEGKNDKAISVEKLDQLERNIREDFERPGTTDYAKGVLFGNAFRLRPLNEREDFFTQKCQSAAKRSKTALVKTPDLFQIARYLEENQDTDYAHSCRLAILQAEGSLVIFPPIPKIEKHNAAGFQETHLQGPIKR